MDTRRNQRSLLCVAALLLVAAPGLCTEVALPEFLVTELDSGMTLYVGEDRAAPLVTLSVVLPVGISCEPPGHEGIGNVTAQACLAGIPGKGGVEIGSELRRLGASTRAWVTIDHTFFTMTSLAANWEEVLSLLAAGILTPTFPDNELSRITNQMITDKRESLNDPGRLAQTHAFALLYDEGRLSRQTSVGGFREMDRDDAAAFHRAHYIPNRAFVVAVGDFDAAEATHALTAAFGRWPSGVEPPPPPALRLRDGGPRVRLVHKPGLTQATIMCIAPGLRAADPDRFAFNLCTTALGGHFNSRLMSALRVQGGKTYNVGSSNWAQLHQGQFTVSTYTRNAETGAALDLINGVLSELVQSGLSEDELEVARTVFLGRYVIGLETQQQLAQGVAGALASGFSVDDYRAEPAQYDAVTLEDANLAVSAHVVPEDLRWVIVGDKREIGDAVSRLGGAETFDYRESARRPGFFERTRVGIGWTGNTAARGVRLSLLHRSVEFSAVYGFGKSDDPWDYEEAGQVTLDLHRGSSEYSSSALYAGVTGTFAEDFRGTSPHVGWRLFPNGLGGEFSLSIEAGASFWDSAELPGFFVSWTVEQFF